MDKRNKPKEHEEQDTTTPGPTTGGMRSMGPQPGEPTLEEKLGVDAAPQDEAPGQHTDDPSRNQGAARQGPPPVSPKKAPETRTVKRDAPEKDSRPPANSPARAAQHDRKNTTRR